jgi:hypothetical protein
MTVLSVSAGVATTAEVMGRDSNVANFRNTIGEVFISGSNVVIGKQIVGVVAW